MCFIVYTHIQSFFDLCTNKKKIIKLRFAKCLLKFLKHIYGELIHTNHNSVCRINIDLIIMKAISQAAQWLITENS